MAAGRQQRVYVDGNLVAGPIDLGDGRCTGSLCVWIRRSTPTAASPWSSKIPAWTARWSARSRWWMSTIATSTPAVRTIWPTRPSGASAALDGTKSTAWGTLPSQSVRVDQDGRPNCAISLTTWHATSAYKLQFTFWQPDGQERIQKVYVDGMDIGLEVDTGDYQVYNVSAAVPATSLRR